MFCEAGGLNVKKGAPNGGDVGRVCCWLGEIEYCGFASSGCDKEGAAGGEFVR